MGIVEGVEHMLRDCTCGVCADCRIDKLEAENSRLREALEFYCNEESWDNSISDDGHPNVWTQIELDGGKRARAALGYKEPRPVPHGEESGMSGMG